MTYHVKRDWNRPVPLFARAMALAGGAVAIVLGKQKPVRPGIERIVQRSKHLILAGVVNVQHLQFDGTALGDAIHRKGCPFAGCVVEFVGPDDKIKSPRLIAHVRSPFIIMVKLRDRWLPSQSKALLDKPGRYLHSFGSQALR